MDTTPLPEKLTDDLVPALEGFPRTLQEKITALNDTLENPHNSIQSAHDVDMQQMEDEQVASHTAALINRMGPQAAATVYTLLQSGSDAERGKNARYILDRILKDEDAAKEDDPIKQLLARLQADTTPVGTSQEG